MTALAGDDSSLWIGTIDRGLLHWNAGALETIDDVLPDKQVLSLALDGDTVYAGTGIGRRGDSRRQVQPHARAGIFCAGAVRGGRQVVDGHARGRHVRVPLDARPGRGWRSLARRACAGCSIRRILRIDGETSMRWPRIRCGAAAKQVIRREDALLARPQHRGADDGCRAGGCGSDISIADCRFSMRAAGAGERFEDDHLFCVNRIAHDAARGISAVATANGLVMFDASTARRRVITQDDGLIANQVTDVVLRADGSAVAATPAGVSFIDASGISSIYAFQGLVNNHVYALAIGRRADAGRDAGRVVDSRRPAWCRPASRRPIRR